MNLLPVLLVVSAAAGTASVRHFGDAPIEGPLPSFSLDGRWTATNSQLKVRQFIQSAAVTASSIDRQSSHT
jgi:hypothetical protein